MPLDRLIQSYLCTLSILAFQATSACFADSNQMLLSDPTIVHVADGMMKLDFKNSPGVTKVYGSSLLDDWRIAYLRGKDEQAEAYLKTIVNKTRGDTNFYPLFLKISQHNAFDESPSYITERTEPKRLYGDMRNSIRRLAGKDSYFLADVDEHCRSKVFSTNEQILEVCLEELAIRKKHPTINQKALWDVYADLAAAQANLGQKQQAIHTYSEARQMLKQFGLAGSDDDVELKEAMEKLTRVNRPGPNKAGKVK